MSVEPRHPNIPAQVGGPPNGGRRDDAEDDPQVLVIVDPCAVVAVAPTLPQRDDSAYVAGSRVGRHRRATPSIAELVEHAIESSAKTWRLAFLVLTVAAVVAAVHAYS